MEKYGKIPDKFTRAWFEYVWEYYKIHIIVTLLVIIAIVYTWIAIATRTYYDLYVCFAGDYALSEDSRDYLTEELKKNIPDINGDDKINVYICDYTVPENFDDNDYIRAMQQKFHLELQAGDSFLFVVPESTAYELVANPSLTGHFESPLDWCGQESNNEYFIKAENSTLLRDAGILYDDLYIGVRNFTFTEGNEDDTAQRENAIKAANFILGK